MLKELKPFMHIVSKLYVKHGEEYYPTCIIEWDKKTIKQEKLDVKEVVNYVNAHIMQLPTDNR